MTECLLVSNKSSTFATLLKKKAGGFQSGQMGQTVNLLLLASVVRIHHHPLILTIINIRFIENTDCRDDNPFFVNIERISQTKTNQTIELGI